MGQTRIKRNLHWKWRYEFESAERGKNVNSKMQLNHAAALLYAATLIPILNAPLILTKPSAQTVCLVKLCVESEDKLRP